MNCLMDGIQPELPPEMHRVALGIEYDGSKFAGWQIQAGRRTIQEILEAALSEVANQTVRVICAGRTDAGVHGLAQVVHFDTTAFRTAYSWQMGGNSVLPPEVRITFAMAVPSDFHARTSAIARHYRYTILNRSSSSALDVGRVTWTPHSLDEVQMAEGAQFLIGDLDFSAFRAQSCQSKSPRRIMHFIHVAREGDRVHLDVCANAFVHHMVRNIAGALMAVGAGKHPPDWIREVLEGRDRSKAGVTAPPDGLYFAGVLYPERFGLPVHSIFNHLPPGTTRFVPPESSEAVSLAENTR
jgi:tRNA pseudouridine38-40 synthase